MRNILAKSHRHVVEKFALSNVVVVLDYDGTLAPIVEDPSRAFMRPRTRLLLSKVAEHYPTAILSGRSRPEVIALLDGVRVDRVLGNHGTEWGNDPSDGADYEKMVQRWSQLLGPRLQGLPGVEMENKRYSLAIHYRRSREKKQALAGISAAVLGLGGAKVYPGKQVMNVVPEGAPHKGLALQKLRALIGCDTAIYVGDDTTDEDVFSLDEPGQLLTVRIGADADTRAAYQLESQREIDRFLALLLRQRSRRERLSA